MSLSGNTGLIGANGTTVIRGSAYIFRNLDTATGTVNESVKLNPPTFFVNSVSLDGDRFTVGSTSGAGTAYTGTVSSVTTLDFGNTSAIIDGISSVSYTHLTLPTTPYV